MEIPGISTTVYNLGYLGGGKRMMIGGKDSGFAMLCMSLPRIIQN